VFKDASASPDKGTSPMTRWAPISATWPRVSHCELDVSDLRSHATDERDRDCGLQVLPLSGGWSRELSTAWPKACSEPTAGNPW
jgi:hypothetical protein